ncbi:hypothetical protein ILUMI_02865 [Ignelater luminosus]|uniref:Peptidase S1 domain-containing protein n=1 Tax=Ignelater luminosus TaxID=2038154 RepID=A0A8K0DBU6_IGNLU|nr:hypothetical protein ILUMI_02865 [Ignelater luminosus]
MLTVNTRNINTQNIFLGVHCMQSFNAPIFPIENLLVVLGIIRPRSWANKAPLCLWQGNDDLNATVGHKETVAGWDREETGKNVVFEAKKIDLPIVHQVTCLRSDIGFRGITSNRTFRAEKPDRSGPCLGNSGAGLAMKISGRWTLRGVVSIPLRNTGTCDPTKYTVFADAAKFRDWIGNALT